MNLTESDKLKLLSLPRFIPCRRNKYLQQSNFEYLSQKLKATVRANFATLANISSTWWLRSATSKDANSFYFVYQNGSSLNSNAMSISEIVPCFVIG